MGKFAGFQAVALTAVLISLGGCQGNDQSGGIGYGDSHIAPIIASPHGDTERKMNIIASQVDAITTKNVHGELQGRTAPHLCQTGFFLTGEYLYWKAHEDGLEYANVLNAKNTFNIDEDPQGHHFKWDSGFRGGVGYVFEQWDQWDLFLNFTHFHGSAKGSVHAHEGESIYANWYPGLFGLFSNKATSRWAVTLNTLDLELGRNYFVSKALTIRPHWDFRAAWIKQTYRAKYNAFTVFTPTSGASLLVNTPAKFKAEQDFTGLGLRTGADMLWHVSSHFGFLGKFSASLLFSRFDIDQEGKTVVSSTPANLNLTPFKVHTDRDYHRVRANLEAFLGFQYETDVLRGRNHLSFCLGYELSEWFQQNQLVQTKTTVVTQTVAGLPANAITSSEPKNGNLDFQGVTFKVNYNF